MTKQEVLKKCPFVRELCDEEIDKLAKLAKVETFEAGEDICRQGRTLTKLYIIEDGLVGLYLEMGPMTQRQLQTASNFEVVGWSAMLPPYRCTAAVKAIETTKVLALNGKELMELCNNCPEIGNKVHRGLASVIAIRLHNAFTQLIGVSVQDLA
jgi:signal-transduction protein with cAMP-binding, CBS, and nucleotidyltransferase domain